MMTVGNGSKGMAYGVIAVLTAILLAFVTNYVSMVGNAVPRSEVQAQVQESEARSSAKIQALEKKQDDIMDKLNDIQVTQGILLEKLKEREH